MKKRALVCFMLCMVLFFVSVLRVATVATDDYSKVQKTQNGIRLKIGDSRGTIYDCNMARLTNCEEKIIACVTPTPRAVTAISQVLEGNELTEVLEQLKGNKPILCEVPEEINCDGIICTRVFSDNQTPSRHIIGYTDNDLKGVSGLEKASDKQGVEQPEHQQNIAKIDEIGSHQGIASIDRRIDKESHTNQCHRTGQKKIADLEEAAECVLGPDDVAL